MPIKDLKERTMIQRLGILRLGEKDEERGFPKKLDYFKVDAKFAPLNKTVTDLYGEEPKALDIMFLSNDDDKVIPQNYERWSRSGLVCRGDGEVGTELIYKEEKQGDKTVKLRTGEDKKMDCANCKLREGDKPACKPVARLMFALPKIPGLGVWQISTSSFNSIKNINRDLKVIRSIFGRISMIPLKLLLIPTEVVHKGRKNTVYILSIQSDKTLEEMITASKVAQIQGHEEETAALPEPDEEGTAEEFFAIEGAEEGAPENKGGEPCPPDDIPGVSDISELPPEEVKPDPFPNMQKEILPEDDKTRKAILALTGKLGYSNQKMAQEIKELFHKDSTKVMDAKELTNLHDRLVIIDRIVAAAKGKFTREELDRGVKEISDISLEMIHLLPAQLQAYEIMIKRQITPKG